MTVSLCTNHGVLRQGILLLPSGRPTAAENGAAIISAIYLSRVYMLTNCPIPLKSIEIDRIHVCLAKEKSLMKFETLTFDFRRLLFDLKQHYVSRV